MELRNVDCFESSSLEFILDDNIDDGGVVVLVAFRFDVNVGAVIHLFDDDVGIVKADVVVVVAANPTAATWRNPRRVSFILSTIRKCINRCT